jgi:NOL1/NOP2/fmu family ribosome biogenesis protein
VKKPEQFIDYFQSRFDIAPEFWESYRIDTYPNAVYLSHVKSAELDGWEVEARGFRVARPTIDGFKPANRLLQYLDDELTKSVIPLNASEFRRILDREPIHPDAEVHCNRGFVAIRFRGTVVGCGFWTGDQLETQMSKSISYQFPSVALKQT